jgi:hypothetical protein
MLEIVKNMTRFMQLSVLELAGSTVIRVACLGLSLKSRGNGDAVKLLEVAVVLV